MKKILVLSGGGSRISYLAGVLDRLSIEPDMILGSSAGALIGYAYSQGRSMKEIKKVLKKVNVFNANKTLREQLSIDLPLKIPVYAQVTKFDILGKYSTQLIDTSNIQEFVTSAYIPFITNYSYMAFEDKFLMDGGAVSNLPVPALLSVAKPDDSITIVTTQKINSFSIETKHELNKSFMGISKGNNKILEDLDIIKHVGLHARIISPSEELPSSWRNSKRIVDNNFKLGGTSVL